MRPATAMLIVVSLLALAGSFMFHSLSANLSAARDSAHQTQQNLAECEARFSGQKVKAETETQKLEEFRTVCENEKKRLEDEVNAATRSTREVEARLNNIIQSKTEHLENEIKERESAKKTLETQLQQCKVEMETLKNRVVGIDDEEIAAAAEEPETKRKKESDEVVVKTDEEIEEEILEELEEDATSNNSEKKDLWITRNWRIEYITECGCTGMEVEATGLLTPLVDVFPNLRINKCDNRCPGMSNRSAQAIAHFSSPPPPPPPSSQQRVDLIISHVAFTGICGAPREVRESNARFRITRSMFEKNSIPTASVPKCNSLWEEVWVPSQFTFDNFASSGVNKEKLFILPEGMDVTLFDPDLTKPSPLVRNYPPEENLLGEEEGKEIAAGEKKKKKQSLTNWTPEDFVFLSNFKWEERKNWPLLISSFVREFWDEENVKLFIKTSKYMGANPQREMLLVLHEEVRNKVKKILSERKQKEEKKKQQQQKLKKQQQQQQEQQEQEQQQAQEVVGAGEEEQKKEKKQKKKKKNKEKNADKDGGVDIAALVDGADSVPIEGLEKTDEEDLDVDEEAAAEQEEEENEENLLFGNEDKAEKDDEAAGAEGESGAGRRLLDSEETSSSGTTSPSTDSSSSSTTPIIVQQSSSSSSSSPSTLSSSPTIETMSESEMITHFVKKWQSRIVITVDLIPTSELPQIYKACDAFVLPSRGEGWGLPLMEAMSMRLPTIATRWSGNTAFMNEENSFLIDFDLVNAPDGGKWAEAREISLRSAMRLVYSDPKLADDKGILAREYIIEKFAMEKVGRTLAMRIESFARRLRKQKKI